MKRIFLLVLFLLVFTFLFASGAKAQVVVVNEISSSGNSDWTEVYFEGVDHTLYRLIDAAGHEKKLSDAVCSGGFCVNEWGSLLNNPGDTVKLELISAPGAPIDSITYGSGGVCAPESGQSVGRVPVDRNGNGGGPVERIATPSKGTSNFGATLAPCSTPTPEPTSTPTSTPSPTPIPTSAPVVVKTPTPKPTPTKSPTPHASSTPAPTIQNSDNQSILGLREGLKPSPSPSSSVLGLSKPLPVLAGGFVLLGGALMAFAGYSFLKRRRAYTGKSGETV